MRGIRLIEWHEPRAARGAHRVVIAQHFHRAAPQHLHQTVGCRGIVLLRVDHILLPLAVRDLCARHLHHRAHDVTAHFIRHAHQRDRGDQFVVHDVTQTPGAAHPRTRIVHARLISEAARVRNDGVGQERDRRRDLRACRFGQQPDHVVPGRCRARAAVPPQIVRDAIADAGLAGLLQGPRHPLADEVDAAHDAHIDILVDRIDVRRHRQSHAVAALLMHIVEHLRKILAVERRADVAALLLRHHVPVTIVVVADVLVIEPRHRSAFERCAESFLVPVDHHLHAVGIGGRHERDHDVLERLLQTVSGGQRIRQFHRHLARADFTAVQIAVDPDHRRL